MSERLHENLRLLGGGGATQAGRTINEDFPGGCYVFAPNGQRLYATPDRQPVAARVTIDLQAESLTG